MAVCAVAGVLAGVLLPKSFGYLIQKSGGSNMRMCSKCGKGRWEGSKKEGKFTCKECLQKEIEKKEGGGNK
jgi:hypothetical protein